MTTPADRRKAKKLHARAQATDDPEAALAMYRDALVLDPNRPQTHYNIGLIHKYRNQWQDSLLHNRRATELAADDQASQWNLAIAATALRDWRTAREVWHRLGMPIEPGDAPIEVDFGMTPVRLNPDDAGEVVWARRIDPVRARIKSIPFPGSGYRHGDVVLHDGAPVGYRRSGGHEYPVFNVLELFEPSMHSTFEAEIHADDAGDVQALCTALDAANLANEDWTTSVRFICRQCCEGRPHEQHDTERKKEWTDKHVLGIAADGPAGAEAALRGWDQGRGRLLRFELKLAPPPRH